MPAYLPFRLNGPSRRNTLVADIRITSIVVLSYREISLWTTFLYSPVLHPNRRFARLVGSNHNQSEEWASHGFLQSKPTSSPFPMPKPHLAAHDQNGQANRRMNCCAVVIVRPSSFESLLHSNPQCVCTARKAFLLKSYYASFHLFHCFLPTWGRSGRERKREHSAQKAAVCSR